MNNKAILLGGNAQALGGIPGEPLAQYSHAKTGTVHNLTGPTNAKYIVFKATGDYVYGDTWAINNAPVTVTYSDGQRIAPTDVLKGDMIMGIVDGNYLRLMNEKPPQGENLLDNWYFLDPVNQRAVSDWNTENSYGIDHWKKAGGTVSILSLVGIRLNGDSSNNCVYQLIEKERLYIGKTYTVSCLTSNGALISTSFITKWHDSWTMLSGKIVDNCQIRAVAGNQKCWSIDIYSVDSGVTTIVAVKLELGSRQTLAHQDADGNWILNDPVPDKAAELAKCQRYFLSLPNSEGGFEYCEIGSGHSYQTNQSMIFIPTPVQMRAKPTVRFEGNLRLRGSKSDVPITVIYVGDSTANGITVRVDTAENALIPRDMLTFMCGDSSAKVFFNAEL